MFFSCPHAAEASSPRVALMVLLNPASLRTLLNLWHALLLGRWKSMLKPSTGFQGMRLMWLRILWRCSSFTSSCACTYSPVFVLAAPMQRTPDTRF